MLTALQRLLVFVVLLPVVVYRKLISPLKRAPSCRFLPTCSEYAIEAVKTRGVVIGVALAVWRILRCNPLCKGGYDPVPDHHGHRHEHDAAACKGHR
jgi:putative membrane protein insertion efficiency factor